MPEKAYITITGRSQGRFAGDGSDRRNKDRIRIFNFGVLAESGVDLSTGQSGGKCRYDPVTITKEWGAASPQIWTALNNQEVLNTVLIEFTVPDPQGDEIIEHTVKLSNATVFSLEELTENVSPPDGPDLRSFDRVRFAYETIELHDKSGKEFTTGAAGQLSGIQVVQVIPVQRH